MRTEVLKFLKTPPKSQSEKFNTAFNFLRSVKGVSMNSIRSYNVQGATDSNIRNIIYDLKKHYGISDAEILSKRSPVEKAVEEVTSAVLSDISGGNPDAATLDDSNIEITKKTDLHSQFPFLTSSDCPAEMHIVTGQLVASWKRYNILHAQLQRVNAGEEEMSEEDKFNLIANCNAEFELNDSLYKELDYFQENKSVLGKVEALQEYKVQKEVDAMSTEELIRFRDNSGPYFSKGKTDLSKPDLPEAKREKIVKKLKEREFRLALVNKKLGV